MHDRANPLALANVHIDLFLNDGRAYMVSRFLTAGLTYGITDDDQSPEFLGKNASEDTPYGYEERVDVGVWLYVPSVTLRDGNRVVTYHLWHLFDQCDRPPSGYQSSRVLAIKRVDIVQKSLRCRKLVVLLIVN